MSSSRDTPYGDSLNIEKEDRVQVGEEEVAHVSERARWTLRDKYGKRGLSWGDKDIGVLKVIDMNKLWMILLAIPAFIFFIAAYMFADNQLYLIVFAILGGFMFVPVGMVIGWVMTNPVMKCRVMRRLRPNSNYGIVQVLSRGKRITKRVKDLDDDLLFIDEKVWPIQDGKIYTYDDDYYYAPIESEHMRKEPGDVPTIHVDLESALPVSFNKEETEIIPQQLGANIKGWVQTQVNKRMFKKMVMRDAILAIAIICAAAAAFLAFQNHNVLQQDIKPLLEQLARKP